MSALQLVMDLFLESKIIDMYLLTNLLLNSYSL